MFFQLLYDGVALGMWAYTRSAFRVEAIGAERLRLEPGSIVVSTHRADTDVPIICPSIYFGARLWRRANRRSRPHFAAREDVFERGFFAGCPRRLPLAVRRALYPVSIGPILTRLPMHPVAHPSVGEIRLARALSGVPASEPLELLLPGAALERFHARARSAGVPEPRTAGAALDGRYADLLWETFTSEQLAHPSFDGVWQARTAAAAAQLRGLVGIVRSGRVLLLFPEGRPSPDGAIGPLRKGVRTLIRRGQPSSVVPLGIAYDPFVRGRVRAHVAFGPPLTELADDPEEEILAALRRATPLTCGQVVAGSLVAAASAGGEIPSWSELADALCVAVDAAEEEGRPVERDLRDPRRRARRLGECLRVLERREIVRLAPGRLVLDAAGALASVALVRAAREHASAARRSYASASL